MDDKTLADREPVVPRQAVAPSIERTEPALVRPRRRRRVPRPLWVTLSAGVTIAVLLVVLAPSDTFTLRGTIALTAAGATSYGIDRCQGVGGYADLRPGATVTVYDSKGRVVGLAPLGSGISSAMSCTFPFEVPDVPADSRNYTVEIGNRGKTTFLPDVAKSGQIALTVG
jgi:hypothetical protein